MLLRAFARRNSALALVGSTSNTAVQSATARLSLPKCRLQAVVARHHHNQSLSTTRTIATIARGAQQQQHLQQEQQLG
jgi:hypothetical protein